MHIDSCRELKMSIRGALRGRQRKGVPQGVRALGARKSRPGIALGLVPCGKQFRLAIRTQKKGLTQIVNELTDWACGEVDVRYVGRVYKQARWHRRRNRPLRIGGSIAHIDIGSGTLGCFVQRDGEDYILSNNHVLADEDRASRTEPVLQPSWNDGGTRSRADAGHLVDTVRLRQTSPNFVDAAKQKAKKQLAEVPGLNGIGITRRDGDYAIQINLEAALDDPSLVPESIDGVPVVPRVIGRIRKQT